MKEWLKIVFIIDDPFFLIKLRSLLGIDFIISKFKYRPNTYISWTLFMFGAKIEEHKMICEELWSNV